MGLYLFRIDVRPLTSFWALNGFGIWRPLADVGLLIMVTSGCRIFLHHSPDPLPVFDGLWLNVARRTACLVVFYSNCLILH